MPNEVTDLNSLTKEELLILCQRQQLELKQKTDNMLYWSGKCSKLEKKLETLKNIIEL